MLEIERLEDRDYPSFVEPNMVLIVTDDQRYDTMQYMPLTQAIFNDGGVEMSNAFVTTPLCCPSRASILTGLYAHNHGVTNNFNGENMDQSLSIAARLPASYQTAFYGKYLNGYGGGYIPQGWDEWHAFKHGSIYPDGGYYNYKLNNNGTIHEYDDRPAHYSTDLLRNKAVNFIEAAAGGSPFFLAFFPRAMHGDPVPAERHKQVPVTLPVDVPPANQANAKRQIRTLMAVDEAVDAIYQAVVDAGELTSTLFIYTSDNGFSWGESGRPVGKDEPYEEMIRVPFLIKFNEHPFTQDAMVLNIDVAPTIYRFYSSFGANMDGRNLYIGVPFVREDFLIERVGQWEGVRGLDYTYVEYENGNKLFFDLANDPTQQINLINDAAWQDEIAAAVLRLEALRNE